MSNTKKWKATTPLSQTSPYLVQGDVGFFSYKKRRYGQFIVFVNTFSKRIFALSINNVKSETLIKTVAALKQEKEFKNTKTILFDGESSLRSKSVQKIIFTNYGIKIHAEPFYKRNIAERAVKEIKLRMALLLDSIGKKFIKIKVNLRKN